MIHSYLKDLSFSRVLIHKEGLTTKPRGNVLNVALSTRATRFDLTFHMQLRQRLRKKYRLFNKGYLVTSETAEWARKKEKFKENDLLQYHISGICVAYKKAGLVTSCLIRNVLSSFPFEYRIPVFSPGVNSIVLLAHHIAPGYRKAKRYGLRNMPPAKGQTSFQYVLYKITPKDYKEYRQLTWS